MASEIAFVHCQTYARKPNRAGQSVAQVVAEGLRSGAFHKHIEDPRQPVPIFGDPSAFQQLHDDHVAQRRTRATKNGLISERAIRADRHTMFTVVASYPRPTCVVENTTEELALFRRWVELNLKWVREQYGTQLKVAFVHTDETFPHIHFWLLADDLGADATLLHPGKAVKRKTENHLKSGGVSPREAVAAGNRALRAAMREWQDSYHRAVGAPLGFERDGPKRRRLSRAQYQAERAALDHHKKLEDDRARLESRVAELEKRAVTMMSQQLELEKNAVDFVNRAERHHRRMKKEAAQVIALGPMLDALVKELDDRTISFDPEIGWRVRDPAPFRAAGRVWTKLEPAIRRFVAMAQAAEDGHWSGAGFVPNTEIAPDDPM